MPAKAKLLMPQMNKIKRILFDKQARRLVTAGNAVADIGAGVIDDTFEFWGNSGRNKFARPQIDTVVTVDQNFTAGNIELSVLIQVIDPTTGKIHFLWHLLDRGRRTYTFPIGKRTPPIPIRKKRRRTFANKLTVDPFSGYTGETFVIHGGQTVRGVPPNNWYETAATETIKRINNNRALATIPWTYSIEQMP